MSREAAVAAIEAHGWTVEFKEWCEDAETPGLLGMRAGVTIQSKKKVKVRTHAMTDEQIEAVLWHELEHVEGAEWATDRADLDLQCGGCTNAWGEPLKGSERPTVREEGVNDRNER